MNRACPPQGKAGVHIAAMNDQLAVVQYLAEEGADLDLGDEEGLTALHLSRSRAVAQVLIKHGANPWATNKVSHPPIRRRLHRACLTAGPARRRAKHRSSSCGRRSRRSAGASGAGAASLRSRATRRMAWRWGRCSHKTRVRRPPAPPPRPPCLGAELAWHCTRTLWVVVADPLVKYGSVNNRFSDGVSPLSQAAFAQSSWDAGLWFCRRGRLHS